MPLNAVLSMLSIVLVFVAIWWANLRMARRLQRAIDELDMLTGETE